MKRILFIGLGCLCVFLATLGIVLPVLPTTPFLLLAFWLFFRSSPRLAKLLLTNRLFGEYLDNYRSGRGIALKIKIWVLTLLWISIGYSALVLIDNIIIQALLLVIAVAVTCHIVAFKTLYKRTNILVLFATEAESTRFVACHKPADVDVAVVGVGSSHAAINTIHLIEQHKPRVVILAGIAGAFRDASEPVEVADTVVVRSEFDGDLGSFSSGTFESKFANRLDARLDKYASALAAFPAVDSLCVNAAAAPFVAREGFAIENMEGWGFFKACQSSNVDFIELRTISNFVGDPFESWQIDAALERLTQDLCTVITKLQS